MGIFVGVPLYDGRLHFRVASAIYAEAARGDVLVCGKELSLLAANCNTLYAMALERRPEVSHFVLWHSDVLPLGDFPRGVLRSLIAEMDQGGYQMISALVAIKDNKGLTSTAMEFCVDGRCRRRRLTMREAVTLPETFGAEALREKFQMPAGVLLANTGLCVLDLRCSFVESLHFAMRDELLRDVDGRFKASVFPEDWFFTKRFQELGGSLAVTRKVLVRHLGNAVFDNQGGWGAWDTDMVDKAEVS